MRMTPEQFVREYRTPGDCATAYLGGANARHRGVKTAHCPYGWSHSRMTDATDHRETSEATLRAWWLAGWHDEDMRIRA